MKVWPLTPRLGQYEFDDGSVWNHDDVLRATNSATTENDDTIQGSYAGDTITGQAGNDLLVGSSGRDLIYENGSYRYERNTTPYISANGNDIYLFGRGDGQDTVIDGDYTTGNSDTFRCFMPLDSIQIHFPKGLRVFKYPTDIVPF